MPFAGPRPEPTIDQIGHENAAGVERVTWSEPERTMILKVIIGGTFHPYFFELSPQNEEDEKDIFYTLNGRDCYTTVYYQGFHGRYIREMYTSSIKQLIGNSIVDNSDMHNVKVSFDDQSEKVFVTFHNNTWATQRTKIPGKAAVEVYKMVKMRKLNMPRTIRVMKSTYLAEKMAENLGLGTIEQGLFIKQNVVRTNTLPSIHFCAE